MAEPLYTEELIYPLPPNRTCATCTAAFLDVCVPLQLYYVDLQDELRRGAFCGENCAQDFMEELQAMKTAAAAEAAARGEEEKKEACVYCESDERVLVPETKLCKGYCEWIKAANDGKKCVMPNCQCFTYVEKEELCFGHLLELGNILSSLDVPSPDTPMCDQ